MRYSELNVSSHGKSSQVEIQGGVMEAYVYPDGFGADSRLNGIRQNSWGEVGRGPGKGRRSGTDERRFVQ